MADRRQTGWAQANLCTAVAVRGSSVSGEVTQMLSDACRGDRDAIERLLPLVYEELHRLAEGAMRRERPDHTLQPTALANDAFLKLVGQERSDWKCRAQFFAVAATVMRRILVDHARQHGRLKRGGAYGTVPLSSMHDGPAISPAADILDLDEALKKLSEIDPQKSRIVEMRHFAGMTNREIAQVLGVAERTVERGWQFARSWLLTRLKAGETRG